jgi:hypothetical protein
MARGISSADPDDLALYSQRGLDLDAALQVRADTLAAAAGDLARSGESVAGLSGYAESLTDLVLDWIHLDQFAGRVANGFLACAASVGCDGTALLTVTDADLARFTQAGYADRDTAIASARSLATEVQALVDAPDATASDMEAVLARTDRGRYDPAFAVTFSERIGVEGYVGLVGRIRQAMLPHGGDDEALAAVGVLGTILTTALATAAAPVTPPAPLGVPRPSAIDAAFVRDLVSGYDTGRLQTEPEATDLSVLLSMTDPPTAMAVDIANARLSPILYVATLTDTPLDSNDPAWLGHSGVVTNYATMLARNPDASAHWLVAHPDDVEGATNMSLVLHQHAERYLDDGRAFATVVENAVAHTNLFLRHDSLDAAIAVLAGPERILDNPYMPDALAHGAAADMGHLEHLANQGWQASDIEPAPTGAWALHSFLTDILPDESAAGTVYGALERYTMAQIAHAPAPGIDWTVGDAMDNRTEALHRIGALQGLVMAAEGNGLQHDAEATIVRQQARGNLVDYAIGLVPGIGELNDIGELSEASIGDLAYPSGFEQLHEAEEIQSLRATDMASANVVMLAVLAHPDGMPRIPLQAMSDQQRADFMDWATRNADGNDRRTIAAASGDAVKEFLPG